MNASQQAESAPVSVDEVLITGELARRPLRPRDHAADSRALVELAREAAEHPQTVLQKLVEVARELCGADSTGVSILEKEGEVPVFRWHAVAGAWARYAQGTLPRFASPCGTVLDRNCSLLFRDPARFFSQEPEPSVHEALLVPFYVRGETAGTLWAVFHRPESRFDAQDERLLTSLSHFAAAAYGLTQQRRIEQELRNERGAALNLMEDALLARRETERANAALRESEERFRAFVTASSDAVYSMSADWTEMRSLVGKDFLPDSHNPNRSWLETYIHPEDRPQVRQAIQEAVRAKTMFELEHRVVRVDGSPAWTHSRAIPLLNAAGEITGWFGTARDITARKAAEDALRRSENLARALISNLPGGAAFILDREMRYVLAQGEALETAGFTPEDFLGKTMDDVLAPEAAKSYRPYVRRAFEGETFEHEHQMDGRWYLSRGVPLRDATSVARVMVVSYDITARKVAEEALRESEARLRIAVEAAEMGTWEWNPQSDEVFWNERHFTLFGMEPQPNPISAAAFFTHIHPEDREWVSRRLQSAVETNTTFEAEFRAVRDDGVVRWMVGYGHNVEEVDGRVTRVSGVMADVTERKRAEAAVRESEARFRTLADAVPQVIWANDAEGRAVYFNQRWFDYSGLSFEDSGGPGWQAIVHPDDAPASVERWKQALSSGETFDTEYRLRRADGVYRWHIGRNVPLRDAGGHIVSWFGSATDIEDRKQIEGALSDREERLRFLVEGTRDYAMFLMNPQRRIFHWNVGAERLFGWSREEVLGQPGDLIFTPEDCATGQPDKEAAQAVQDGHAPNIRWHLRKDGSRFWSDGIITSLKNEAGALLGFTKVMRDATREKQADEELQRAHDELEQRVQERTKELRSEVVHRRRLERERLRLLKGLVTAQEEERKRLSRELHDQMGQHLTALMLGLKSLPDIKEPGLSRATPNGQLKSLQQITEELTEQVHYLAWELRPATLDNIGLQAALRQYVGEWSHRTGVSADFVSHGLADGERLPGEIESALYRVVQEALTNASRHSGATRVSVLLERRGDVVQAIVEDNGKGFNTEQRTNRLGLVGIRERMELVNGTLEIESEPQEGTALYARVPLLHDVVPSEESEQQPEE